MAPGDAAEQGDLPRESEDQARDVRTTQLVGQLARAERRAQRAEQRLAEAERREQRLRTELAEATTEHPRARANSEANDGIAPPADGELDVNAVDFEHLRSLGLGVAESARLLAVRDLRGGLRSLEELDEIRGLSSSAVEMLKKRLVCVS